HADGRTGDSLSGVVPFISPVRLWRGGATGAPAPAAEARIARPLERLGQFVSSALKFRWSAPHPTLCQAPKKLRLLRTARYLSWLRQGFTRCVSRDGSRHNRSASRYASRPTS